MVHRNGSTLVLINTKPTFSVFPYTIQMRVAPNLKIAFKIIVLPRNMCLKTTYCTFKTALPKVTLRTRVCIKGKGQRSKVKGHCLVMLINSRWKLRGLSVTMATAVWRTWCTFALYHAWCGRSPYAWKWKYKTKYESYLFTRTWMLEMLKIMPVLNTEALFLKENLTFLTIC